MGKNAQRRRGNPLAHNYMARILAAAHGPAGAALFPRGQVTLVTVVHDDWCRVWKNGLCNCRPVIRTRGA